MKIIVKKEFDNLRDYFLDLGLGKTKIYELDINHLVKINDKIATFHEKINKDDILDIDLSIFNQINFKPYELDLNIIYEDDYFLIVNKPSNMIIYSDTENNTLCNVVRNYYETTNQQISVRYIHRIDRDTTGIVVFVKDIITQAIMDKKIKDNIFYKEYRALVSNHLKNKEGILNYPIGSDRHNNNKYVVCKNGKEAITKYKVIKEYDYYSLVNINLLTGRTHQIRVHFSYINNPLLGDILYNGNSYYINRVALHAYKVKFIHPYTNKEVEFIANYYPDFEKLI